MNDFLLRGFLLLTYILLVVVNVIAGTSGANTRISAEYPTPLTPSGWAFSIWGVIFFLQGAWTVFILVPYQNDRPAKTALLRKITVPLCLGWISQCVWQLVFNSYHFVAASIAIWAAFLCMFWAMFETYELHQTMTLNWLDRTVCWGVSINTAWLSVAGCLGLFIHALSEGASDESLTTFVVLAPVAITFLAIYLSMRYHEVLYPLTLTWAITAVKDNSESNLVMQVGNVVQGLTIFVAVLQMLRLLFTLAQSKMQPKDESGPLSAPLITEGVL